MFGKLEEKKQDVEKKAVKKILIDMQTKLIEAKDAQKQDILRAGGGGSDNDLTNWDGTKKKSGWSR